MTGLKRILASGWLLACLSLPLHADVTVMIDGVHSAAICPSGNHLFSLTGYYAYESLDRACLDSELYTELKNLGYDVTDGSADAAWKAITAIRFDSDCRLNFADVFVLRYLAGFDSRGTTAYVVVDANARKTEGRLASIDLENVRFATETMALNFVYSTDVDVDGVTWSKLPYTTDAAWGEFRIPSYAFYGLPALKRLKLHSTCSCIGERSFYNCVNLNSIDFSRCTGLKTIEEYAFASDSIAKVDLSACHALATLEEGCFWSTRSEWVLLPQALETLGNYALEGSANDGKTLYISHIVFTGKQLPAFGQSSMSMFAQHNHGTRNTLSRIYVRETLVDALLEKSDVILDNKDEQYGYRIFPLLEGHADGLPLRTFSYFRPLDFSVLTGLRSGSTTDMTASTVTAYNDTIGLATQNAGLVLPQHGVLLDGCGEEGELYFPADETSTVEASGNLLVGNWKGGNVYGAYGKHYYMLRGGKFVRMLDEGDMPAYKAYLNPSGYASQLK